MSRLKSVFVCQACGSHHPRWMGRCTSCGDWNTVVEEGTRGTATTRRDSPRLPVRLGEVTTEGARRLPTGLHEFDRVLGGGLVAGGVTLVGGDPGIGKSTLLMQALAALSSRGTLALYVTGEESASQVALRARRLDAEATSNIDILATTELSDVVAAIRSTQPEVVVVDSIQTLRTEELTSAPGTVGQVRAVSNQLVDLAKERGVCLLLIGHVTKEGMLAGPKVLEHLVDTVLSFEGDATHAFRLLRTQKNRFGPAHEVGVFEMHENGLREVADPSSMLLAERPEHAAGSVIVPIAEGTRPLLVEVQALVAPAAYGTARRVVSGLDGNRLAILLAVLERKAQLHVLDCDVFASIAGGVRVDERAADLPLALAVVSSLRERPVADYLVALGEVGLAGELRAVPRVELRLAEAHKLGFRRAVVPAGNAPTSAGPIEVIPAKTLTEALDAAFD